MMKLIKVGDEMMIRIQGIRFSGGSFATLSFRKGPTSTGEGVPERDCNTFSSLKRNFQSRRSQSAGKSGTEREFSRRIENPWKAVRSRENELSGNSLAEHKTMSSELVIRV